MVDLILLIVVIIAGLLAVRNRNKIVEFMNYDAYNPMEERDVRLTKLKHKRELLDYQIMKLEERVENERTS